MTTHADLFLLVLRRRSRRTSYNPQTLLGYAFSPSHKGDCFNYSKVEGESLKNAFPLLKDLKYPYNILIYVKSRIL